MGKRTTLPAKIYKNAKVMDFDKKIIFNEFFCIFSKILRKSEIKCPRLHEIRNVVVNGQASLECLEDRGPDKYKLGCYIRGELLSIKVGTVEKLKEWAVGKKHGFLYFRIIL